MPQYPNIHKFLENAEVHVPRDFGGADNDSQLEKDGLGEIKYRRVAWQYPVLNFVDAASPPPTQNNGDRYVLTGTTATTVDAGWDGVAINSIAEYYQTNNPLTGVASTINRWVGSTMQPGSVVFSRGANNNGINVYNGVNWNNVAPGNESCATQCAKLTIASSAILTCNSSPVEIIPAPGAGKAIQVISAYGKLDFNSAAYTGDTAIQLMTSDTERPQLFNEYLLIATSDIISTFYYNGNAAKNITENTAIVLSTPTSNPATGDSDLIIGCTYRIIDL